VSQLQEVQVLSRGVPPLEHKVLTHWSHTLPWKFDGQEHLQLGNELSIIWPPFLHSPGLQTSQKVPIVIATPDNFGQSHAVQALFLSPLIHLGTLPGLFNKQSSHLAPP